METRVVRASPDEEVAPEEEVPVGEVGQFIYTSRDLAMWTPRYFGKGNTLNGIVWNGATFVAVGDNGLAVSSADGVIWREASTGTAETLYGVAWNGALFTAVGTRGARVESADGLSWAPVDSSTSNDLFNVKWSGGRLIAVGRYGTILADSCGAQRQGVEETAFPPSRRSPHTVGR